MLMTPTIHLNTNEYKLYKEKKNFFMPFFITVFFCDERARYMLHNIFMPFKLNYTFQSFLHKKQNVLYKRITYYIN